MNTNMPILWQNCLMQFHTEIGRKAWIWFAESRGIGMQYDTDRYALEVEHLVTSLKPKIEKLDETHCASEEVMDYLMRFILTRHANWRLGSNVKPTYLNNTLNNTPKKTPITD